MVNIGMIWGIGLGLLFLLAIYIYVRMRIKKEVKVIDVVQRPEETRTEVKPPTNSGNLATESGTDNRVSRKKFKRESKKQRGVQTKSSKAVEPDEQGDKQYSPATQPPEPFIY